VGYEKVLKRHFTSAGPAAEGEGEEKRGNEQPRRVATKRKRNAESAAAGNHAGEELVTLKRRGM